MAIIGHTFPVYYGFKGGKGVATSLGALLVINPQIGLICLVFAIVIIIATRWVSLRFNYGSYFISNFNYIYG